MSIFKFITSNKIGALLFDNAKAIFDGNSLSLGYPGIVQTLFDENGLNVNCVNIAVSAQNTSDMEYDANTEIDPNWISGKTNLLVAYEIGNDLYTNGDINGACDRFAQYCVNRKQAANTNGIILKIIVITCTPRANVNEHLLLPANEWLKLNYHQFANRIVDLRSDNRLLDINNTTYYSDQVHYTSLGNQIVAEMVYNEINKF